MAERLDFLVERLNAIGNYQVYVTLPDYECAVAMSIKEETLQVCALPVNGRETEKSRSSAITLPCIERNGVPLQYTVIPSQDGQKEGSAYAQCKLPFSLGEQQSTHYTPPNTLPSVSSLSQLTCRGCETSLRTEEESEIKRVLPLPSEYWLELSELWVCHNPDNFQHFPKETLRAKEEHCLVSATYFMFPGSALCLSKLTVEESSSRQEWRAIRCANCNHLLGLSDRSKIEKDYHDKMGPPPLVTYKLFKSSLSGSSFVERHTLESKLAQDLFALSQARSCYRIFVFSSSSSFFMQVQILSWNSHVIRDDPTQEARPILKLLYKTTEDQVISESDKIALLQKEAGNAEELTLEDDECCVLATLLHEHSLSFPAPIRSAFAANMTLSFLHFYEESPEISDQE